MGAEMGATTSIFPADAQVKKFMTAQGRGDQYVEMLPDEDAEYDECIDINLSELESLISCPHQPDNVIPLKDAEKKTRSAGIYRKLYECELCRYRKSCSRVQRTSCQR